MKELAIPHITPSEIMAVRKIGYLTKHQLEIHSEYTCETPGWELHNTGMWLCRAYNQILKMGMDPYSPVPVTRQPHRDLKSTIKEAMEELGFTVDDECTTIWIPRERKDELGPY